MTEEPSHLVSCSAYAIAPDGRVLLVRTEKRPETWELPGGKIEEGEPLLDGFVREVIEETGIRISPLGVATVQHLLPRDKVFIVFRANAEAGDPIPQRGEILEASFFDPSDLDRLITHPYVLEAARRAQSGVMVPFTGWSV